MQDKARMAYLQRFESVIQDNSLTLFAKSWDYRWEVDDTNGKEPLAFRLMVIPGNHKVLSIEAQHLDESEEKFLQRMKAAQYELRRLPLHGKHSDKKSKQRFSIDSLYVKLYFRKMESGSLRKDATWHDVRFEHYESWGDFVPIAEFGSMGRFIQWINRDLNFVSIGYPRQFSPHDIFLGRIYDEVKKIVLVSFFYETSDTGVLHRSLCGSAVTEADMAMVTIPVRAEISVALRNRELPER